MNLHQRTRHSRRAKWWIAALTLVGGLFHGTQVNATTCANATNIASLPVTAQSLVCGIGNDLSSTTVPAVCGAASNSYKGGNEALYTYTAVASGSHAITISGQTWTSIFVYQGCPTAGGTCVGSVGTSASSKTLNVTLTAGLQYFIWFDTWPTPNSPCPGTFTMTAPPACPAPTSAAATGITATSANANWTSGGGSGTFIVEYGPAATFTTPGTGATAGPNGTVISGAVAPQAITGLSALTGYRYFVRQNCGVAGFSANSAGQTFVTACGGTACAYTLRLTDSFGDGWNGATMQIRLGTTVVATVGSTFTTGFGPVDVSVPGLCEGAAYNLFWSAGGSFASEVGVQLIDPFGTSLYIKPPGTGSALTQLFAFTASCTPPACAPVTGLSASSTGATSASVNWTCASCTGGFIVEYGAPGFTPGTGLTAGAGGTIATTTAVAPYALTGLVGGSNYTVAVRQNCGGTFSTNQTANFSTPPGCGSGFFDSGGAAGNYQNGENQTITICPSTPGDVVTVTFSSVQVEAGWDFLNVYNANTVSGPATGIFTGQTPVFTANNPSGCLTFTFTSDPSVAQAGWAATVTCAPPPTCPTPTSAAASGVTNNSAVANWTNNGGGGSFIVEYGPTATFTTPGTDANPGAGGTVITGAVSPQAIGGLTSSTQYRYFVRQDCGSGDFSPNSGAQVFTTLAEPPNCATAPVIECGASTVFTAPAGNGVWGATFCGFGVPGIERVYRFTAPVAGTYELQVTASPGNWVDYGWKSATGVCDNTGWTCIDDIFGVGLVTFNLPAAGEYWIVADPEITTGATQTFQINGPCFPGAATATVVDDCDNSQYSIDVNITDLGSGATAGVRYSVNGGADVDATGLGLGVTTVGPFALTDIVEVTLLSGDEAICNVVLGEFSSNCPINISCGSTTTVNYCYKNNDSKTWTFNSPTAGETVTLTFVSGTIDEVGDVVRIYDGTDNTGTLLVSSTVNSLVGLTATSTGQSIYMEVDSDPSNSCQDGNQSSWTFEVECTPGCVDPDGSVTVTTDCASYSFSIDVEILFVGDAPNGTTSISYAVNGGTPTVIPGLVDFDVQNIGPFTVDDVVSIQLLHETDPLCNRNLGTFTDNGTCPPLSENCISAQNLQTLPNPYSSTTAGFANDLTNTCAFGNTAPDRVFFIDVPNLFQLSIVHTSPGYDSEITVFYGGACPGGTQIACWDDPDDQTVNWTNTTGSTQRVYWVQDGWNNSAATAGTFTLNWSLTAPCTGTPAPGATLSTSTTVCPLANFTLSLATPPTAVGITFQWFVSTVSATGPWTPISGATSATLVRNQTVQSWYYCEATCPTGPNTGSSTPIQVNLNPDPIACLCTPTYTFGKTDGDLISNVVITGTTLSNNTGTDPVNPAYTFFNTLPNHTGTLVAGASYPIQVTYGSFTGQQVAVWIDFNENGVFETPSERVGFSSVASASSFQTVSFTLSLPCNPTPGPKRMRVRNVWNTPGNSIDPCLNYSWGETEDYTVTVDPPPPCPAPSGLAASNITVSTANLNWVLGCAETAWVVQYGLTGFTLGTGTTVNTTATTASLSGLSSATTYDAYVRANCDANGLSSWFGPITFTTATPPPANDLCENAIAITCNSVTTGTTVAATTTGALAFCGTTLNTAGGVWYTLPGWDGPMTASLCGAEWDTKIGVFTGSCGVFTCITGNDDFCGLQSQVSWTGSNGTTYYIYVTGFGAATGPFTLTTSCGSNNSACTENGLTMEFQTDFAPFETTWEIRNAAGTIVVTSGGPLVAPFGVQTESGCVPDGCYTLRVLDAGGDGMTTGGYILRTQGTNRRIIDNRNNFSNGSLSAISGGQGFCLPMSNQGLLFTSCDKLDWINGQYMVATPDPAVSAEWVVGGSNAVQDNNSGYEFWIFDPNGSYSFRRFRSHNVSDGFGPASATRACHMRMNNWAVASQVPTNVLMNVRVRARVNGVNGEFGPACRMAINPVLAACPLTNLMDITGNQFFSCGVFRNWGTGNFVHARPVTGANRYQFRFRLPAEGFEVVRTATTYFVQLNWPAAQAPALQNGKTYDVDVRISRDGGLTWCTSNNPWGNVCQVTIGAPSTGLMAALESNVNGAELTMFPNPNRGDVLSFSLSAIEEGVNTVSMDVYDLSGKRVITRELAVAGSNVITTVDLNGELAAGMYSVNIIAGSKSYNERLVIQP
jgi:hypothetical protein